MTLFAPKSFTTTVKLQICILVLITSLINVQGSNQDENSAEEIFYWRGDLENSKEENLKIHFLEKVNFSRGEFEKLSENPKLTQEIPQRSTVPEIKISTGKKIRHNLCPYHSWPKFNNDINKFIKICGLVADLISCIRDGRLDDSIKLFESQPDSWDSYEIYEEVAGIVYDQLYDQVGKDHFENIFEFVKKLPKLGHRACFIKKLVEKLKRNDFQVKDDLMCTRLLQVQTAIKNLMDLLWEKEKIDKLKSAQLMAIEESRQKCQVIGTTKQSNSIENSLKIVSLVLDEDEATARIPKIPFSKVPKLKTKNDLSSVCTIHITKLTDLKNELNKFLSNSKSKTTDVKCSYDFNNSENCKQMMNSIRCGINHVKRSYKDAVADGTEPEEVIKWRNEFESLSGRYQRELDDMQRSLLQDFKFKMDAARTEIQTVQRDCNRLKEEIQYTKEEGEKESKSLNVRIQNLEASERRKSGEYKKAEETRDSVWKELRLLKYQCERIGGTYRL